MTYRTGCLCRNALNKINQPRRLGNSHIVAQHFTPKNMSVNMSDKTVTCLTIHLIEHHAVSWRMEIDAEDSLQLPWESFLAWYEKDKPDQSTYTVTHDGGITGVTKQAIKYFTVEREVAP